MTRRFEYTDEKSNKFWEITVKGKKVTVQYGRIGTDGQAQEKAYATPAEARTAVEKQIAEKVKKGYREVGAAGNPSPLGKSEAKSAAKKTPAEKSNASNTFAPSIEIDNQQLDALNRLFSQEDADAVSQGVELMRSLNDSSLSSEIAKGLEIGKNGAVKAFEFTAGNRKGLRYSRLAVLRILLESGTLNNVRRLDLSDFKGLRDVSFLTNLRKLQILNLSGCEDLTTLDGLNKCAALRELALSGCTQLASLDGLRGCKKLEALELYSYVGSSSRHVELGVLHELEEREVLPRDPYTGLPISCDAGGGDGYWGQSDSLAGQFTKLRAFLQLPNLECVYLRMPSDDEIASAERDNYHWESEPSKGRFGLSRNYSVGGDFIEVEREDGDEDLDFDDDE